LRDDIPDGPRFRDADCFILTTSDYRRSESTCRSVDSHAVGQGPKRPPKGNHSPLAYSRSEFVQLRVEDLHLALDPPQVYIGKAKGGSDGYVPILPALAQELRTHLGGRRNGYVFESNRSDKYTPRYVQRLIKDAAQRAGIDKNVTPHRLRASVATILLDAGMPLDQVQKFFATSGSLPPRSTPKRAFAAWARTTFAPSAASGSRPLPKFCLSPG
jgi:integrase